MAPYVPQWYAALGTQESRYILYKVGGWAGCEERVLASGCWSRGISHRQPLLAPLHPQDTTVDPLHA